MSKLEAVVFDLDDTLYPERSYVLSGFSAVADWAERTLAIPRATVLADLRAYFDSGVRGDTFDRWLSARGLSRESHLASLVETYRSHRPDIAPYPEIPTLLDRLRRRFRLGLITEGYRAVQEMKLKALGLQDYFECCVITDMADRARWKPHTHAYRVLLEQLDVPATHAVYIGDNPRKDFAGARSLGMRTVRLRLPHGLNAQVESPTPEQEPDLELTDLDPLEPLLHRWHGEGA